jgi:hypothetical protein
VSLMESIRTYELTCQKVGMKGEMMVAATGTQTSKEHPH